MKAQDTLYDILVKLKKYRPKGKIKYDDGKFFELQINIIKQKTCKFEIACNYYGKYLIYKIKSFRRTKYGGYAIVGKEQTITESKELINEIENLWKLPEVERTESKPKGNRGIILQNAIADMIKEKCHKIGMKVRSNRIASVEKAGRGKSSDKASFCVGKFLSVCISQEKVTLYYSKLCASSKNSTKEIKEINIDPMTVDPDKITDVVIDVASYLLKIDDDIDKSIGDIASKSGFKLLEHVSFLRR